MSFGCIFFTKLCVFFCNVENESSQGADEKQVRDKDMKGCVGGVQLRKQGGEG